MRREILVVSDVHYACAAEQARRHHEIRAIKNPVTRVALKLFRDYIWLRNPYDQNHLLDQFMERTGQPDFVVANGDYTCNTGFVGVADNAACESAKECLGKLRARFGKNFRANFGDHELGKFSFVGGFGGLRLASWHRAVQELCLQPFWQVEMDQRIVMGVTSTLLALPVYEPDMLREEREAWFDLRKSHLAEIERALNILPENRKIILFCHDPTALPFLWREDFFRRRISQIEVTIIGHLHSPLVFWKSGLLAGIPQINFLGNSVRRYTGALREARLWKHFNVRLCPSLAGIELLKDGGYLSLEWDGAEPVQVKRHRIRR